MDRAYRVGQTRPVVVYRLISCGTIEEKIYRKQVFKDTLSKARVAVCWLLFECGCCNGSEWPKVTCFRSLPPPPTQTAMESGQQMRYFTGQDLRDLFTLGDTDNAVTQAQVSRSQHRQGG